MSKSLLQQLETLGETQWKAYGVNIKAASVGFRDGRGIVTSAKVAYGGAMFYLRRDAQDKFICERW
jgi:hypothetical protein